MRNIIENLKKILSNSNEISNFESEDNNENNSEAVSVSKNKWLYPDDEVIEVFSKPKGKTITIKIDFMVKNTKT